MTQDEYENMAAANVVVLAEGLVDFYVDKASIKEGAVGILIRALELATPDLSPARRASLFEGEEQ